MVSSRIRRARTAVSEATADILIYRRRLGGFKRCKWLEIRRRCADSTVCFDFCAVFVKGVRMRAMIVVLAALLFGGCATAPKIETVAHSEDARLAVRNQGYTLLHQLMA